MHACGVAALVVGQLHLLALAQVPDSVHPDYYYCETQTCALYDGWVNVPAEFENSTGICQGALQGILTGIAVELPMVCKASRRGGQRWDNCQARYCEAFDTAMRTLLHMGGPEFYGGETCQGLLAFNRSICEKDYRDAQAMCDCFCPTLELFEPPPMCEAEIWAFLFFGRRGAHLAQEFPLTEFCADALCRYFEIIGDPDPIYPPDFAGGIPSTCHNIDLPIRRGQCKRMLSSSPYEPCPWLTSGAEDDVLKCTDGTSHEVDIRHIDTWGVCAQHDYRKHCPANYPVMCAERNCVGEGTASDHCCQTDVGACRSGEARGCSVAVDADLPEWHGLLTPSAAARRVTSTTLDPLTIYNLRKFTTTPRVSLMEKVQDAFPWLVASIGLIGAIVAVVLCVMLGRHHVVKSDWVMGAAKIMKAYKDPDRVTRYLPSGEVPDKERRELPPLRTDAEIEAERADAEACTNLANAIDRAQRHGMASLVSEAHPTGPTGTELVVRQAIDGVFALQLQAKGKNFSLIALGEQWLRTLEAERELVAACTAARPELHQVIERMQPLATGAPWLSTKVGQTANQAVKVNTWQNVEELSEALKRAKAAGAGDMLVRESAALLAQIVARMQDLPADRCVLDPGGEGIRILPQGTQRAVFLTTGDPYLYSSDLGTADEAGEHGVPPEDLGGVSVDDARPVCAEWASKGTCRAGKRCPWRHVKPKPGDSIRECIIFEDA